MSTSMQVPLDSNRYLRQLVQIVTTGILWSIPASMVWSAEPAGFPSAADHASIQAALDAHPGQPIYVPAGDHEIREKLRLRHHGCGLWGPGRIIQTNPNEPIIEIENAEDVRIRDITLTRPVDSCETANEGILAIRCVHLELDGVRVFRNRTRSSAIELRNCLDSQVRHCFVRDYMRLGEDDRTQSPDWGYAFRCINGSGIVLHACRGTLIQGNRVVETELLPTKELRERHRLGSFTKKNAQRGAITNPQVWDAEYTDAWHQGSAIVVTAPEISDLTRIVDNHIENAAQGIDLHADRVIVAQNVVVNAAIGMKAMHGSRHTLITGNQFVKNDLWAIGLMPGAASHSARPLADAGSAESAAANIDGGTVVAQNIISDFGFGNASWNWSGQGTPLRFDNGQKPDNPPLTDVMVVGNVLYDSGRDQIAIDGQPQPAPPRYRYAVRISAEVRGLHFSANLFHPGTDGIANIPLPP